MKLFTLRPRIKLFFLAFTVLSHFCNLNPMLDNYLFTNDQGNYNLAIVVCLESTALNSHLIENWETSNRIILSAKTYLEINSGQLFICPKGQTITIESKLFEKGDFSGIFIGILNKRNNQLIEPYQASVLFLPKNIFLDHQCQSFIVSIYTTTLEEMGIIIEPSEKKPASNSYFSIRVATTDYGVDELFEISTPFEIPAPLIDSQKNMNYRFNNQSEDYTFTFYCLNGNKKLLNSLHTQIKNGIITKIIKNTFVCHKNTELEINKDFFNAEDFLGAIVIASSDTLSSAIFIPADRFTQDHTYGDFYITSYSTTDKGHPIITFCIDDTYKEDFRPFDCYQTKS